MLGAARDFAVLPSGLKAVVRDTDRVQCLQKQLEAVLLLFTGALLSDDC